MDEEINEFSPENSPKSDMMMMPSPLRDMAPISPPETTTTQPEAITAVVEELEPEEKAEIKEEIKRFKNFKLFIQTELIKKWPIKLK